MITLTKIQSELKAPKNLTNKFGGYSYRSCEGILESVKPILDKYEATLIISDDIVSVKDKAAIVQSISALLLTNKGERPFQPDLGSDLRRALFQPLDYATAAIIKEKVR